MLCNCSSGLITIHYYVVSQLSYLTLFALLGIVATLYAIYVQRFEDKEKKQKWHVKS